MIKPHHIFLQVAFLLSVLAYSPVCDLYTVEGFTRHSQLMATCYVLVLAAAWRMNHDHITRLHVNIFQGLAVGNLSDELYFGNTEYRPWEYAIAALWISVSITIFLIKNGKLKWLRNFKMLSWLWRHIKTSG